MHQGKVNLTVGVVDGVGSNALFKTEAKQNEANMPARKPLPTAVKEIKGTLQPCRTNRNEPRSSATLGSVPDYMSESAKEAWYYAVTNAPAGLLRLLTAQCWSVGRTAPACTGKHFPRSIAPGSPE